MSTGSIGYALLCVAAPLAWGLLVVWAVGLFERRFGAEPAEEPERPLAMDDKA